MTNYAKNETEDIAKIVRECFSCDPNIGDIVRISAGIRHQKFIGISACIPTEDRHGMKYFKMHIKGRVYLAHRVCWLLYYGEWADSQIDHKDRDGRNNRMSNLRLATSSQNAHNSNRRDTKSGCVGVYWQVRSRRWYARIKFEGKERHLGMFKNIEDAIQARKEAEKEFGIDLLCSVEK